MTRLVVIVTVFFLLCTAAWPRAAAADAAVPLQAGAETPPPGWREATGKAMDLTLAGKDLELVAIYEKFVAQYPNFAEAHFRLGAAYESAARATIGSRAPDAQAMRAKYFDAAILHMRHGIDLAGRRAPFDWMRGFIDIHGIVGVDRPAEYERLVRAAVKQYPAEPYAHSYLLALFAQKGQPIEAAAAAARAAIPKTAAARVDLAGSLASYVNDFRRLMPASGMQALLAEASSLVDEALKLKPNDADALRTRARIEQLRKP
jgi:hypothetical protein